MSIRSPRGLVFETVTNQTSLSGTLRCCGYLEGAREECGGFDPPAAAVVHHHVLHHVGQADRRHVVERSQSAQRRVVADEHVAAVGCELGHLLHRRDDAFGDGRRLLPVLLPVPGAAVLAQELVDAHGLLHVLRAREEADEERRVLDDVPAVFGVVAVSEDVLRGLHRALHVRAVDPVDGDAGEVGVVGGGELLQTERGVGIAGLLAVAEEEQGDSAH